MKSIVKQVLLFSCIVGTIIAAEQSFVIKKGKKKGPSMSALKEQYATRAGDLIKVVPKVEQHLVSIHSRVITEVDDLLNNDSESGIAGLSKEQLEERTKKIAQLTQQIEKFDEQLREIVSSLSTVKTN